MHHVDVKYLLLFSSRLPRFKQTKRGLYNCRCIICGDSQRSKTKARGFFFEVKGEIVYKCHNCGVSMSLSKFLEQHDINLYKEYRMEKFTDTNKPRTDMRKVKRVVSKKPTFKKESFQLLTPISKLNNSHPAREYLLNRKLPISALYYTEKFKEWTNSVKPNTFDDISQDEGRIIIPFVDTDGKVFGFQGRSLSKDGLRYITILLDEDKPKVFGLNTLKHDQTVYVTEGPFDSLLLDNAIAMAGADLSDYDLDGGDFVYVYDNEPRNQAICDRIKRRIDSGDQVVIWPKDILEKDINDMVLSGHDVQNMVESCTYSGLTATLKYKEWSKV